MKILKLCALMVVLAAVVVPAEAVTLPPYANGTLYLASRNQDNGATYFVGDPANFNATQQDLTLAQFQGAGGSKILAPGSFGGEDSWGIFRMYHIEPGQLTALDSQVTAVGPSLWDDSAGTDSTQLVGVFWGGVDQTVRISNIIDLSGGAWTSYQYDVRIVTTGLEFELWGVDKTALDASALAAGVGPVNNTTLVDYVAPGGGVRPIQNEYPGWLDATSKAGGIPVLHGTSTQVIIDGTLKITPAGTTQKFDTSVWFDIDENGGGAWDATWGSDPKIISDNGTPSDVWFNWTVTNSTENWSVQSQDNGGVSNVVPEPVTMLGLFLGVGSVGGYLRRRSRA